MARHVVGTLIVVLIIGGGCAARSGEQPQAAARSGARPQVAASQGYQLIHPPDVADTRYPGGFHIRSHAPLASWHQVAVFATLEECESSRVTRIDDAIDKARIEVGDQAKYQLPVRRAVNARCVSAQ
jgi:hypothetical protein